MSLLSSASKVRILIAAAAALLGVACSGADAAPAYTGADLDSDGVQMTGQPLSCSAGSVRSCTIWLGQHGDLANCVHGLDVCADGAWTGCIDEETLSSDPELYATLVGDGALEAE